MQFMCKSGFEGSQQLPSFSLRYLTWHSDAYLAYIRERRAATLSMLTQLAGANADDLEANFVDIYLNGFDADDYE